MVLRYKNIGGGFPAADGTRWERNEERVNPDPRDLELWSFTLRAVGIDGEAEAEAPRLFEAVGWPLRMAPAVYLKLHPEGQHADLARRLLGEGQPDSPPPLVDGPSEDPA